MTATLETNRDWQGHWRGVGGRVAADDLFRQVERTIGGVPEPPGQIEHQLAAATHRLCLDSSDIVLDLCCGNGLFTARLAALCHEVVGVDFSPDLIAVARRRSAASNLSYLLGSVEDLAATDLPTGPPGKICMISGLQYFTAAVVERLLQSLRSLGRGDAAVFLSDVPDAARLDAFYDTPARKAEFERRRADGSEAIGTWWDRDHLASVMAAAGYRAEFLRLAPVRLTAHYRFDVLARPRR